MPKNLSVGQMDDSQLLERLGMSLRLTDPIGGDRVPEAFPLSATEKRVLRSGGALGLDEEALDTHAAVQEQLGALIAECRALVYESYDQEGVAELLQVPQPEVMRQKEIGGLHAFLFGKGSGFWLFPGWQFFESGTIPRLEALLSVVRRAIHPLILSRFMQIKNADLVDDSETIFTPREWLIGGHDPSFVLNIAADL